MTASGGTSHLAASVYDSQFERELELREGWDAMASGNFFENFVGDLSPRCDVFAPALASKTRSRETSVGRSFLDHIRCEGLHGNFSIADPEGVGGERNFVLGGGTGPNDEAEFSFDRLLLQLQRAGSGWKQMREYAFEGWPDLGLAF